jgi:hypothetical protein
MTEGVNLEPRYENGSLSSEHARYPTTGNGRAEALPKLSQRNG